MIKKLLSTSLICSCFLYGESLKELVDLAQNNKQIKSSMLEIKSLQDEYESFQDGNLPNISIGAKLSSTNKESASLAKNGFTGYAKANYVLYDGSYKSNIYDSYEYDIKSSHLNLEQLKNKIALDVVGLYFSYQTLLSLQETKEKEIETLKAQQQRLQNFLDVGNATNDEVDKITSRLEGANVALKEIELQLQTILHTLEYITSKHILVEKNGTIKDVENITPTHRADIEALKQQNEKLLANSKASKSGNYPTLSLDDTYYHYDNNYDNKNFDNGINNQNVISLNLAWKLFDFGATDKKYESSYKKYLASVENFEYEKYKANVDLQLAYKAYQIALAKIGSAKANLKAANSAYETIEAKYQNGIVDNVAYLDALSEKFSSQSIYQQALNELEIQKANIIYFSGNKLQEYIK